MIFFCSSIRPDIFGSPDSLSNSSNGIKQEKLQQQKVTTHLCEKQIQYF